MFTKPFIKIKGLQPSLTAYWSLPSFLKQFFARASLNPCLLNFQLNTLPLVLTNPPCRMHSFFSTFAIKNAPPGHNIMITHSIQDNGWVLTGSKLKIIALRAHRKKLTIRKQTAGGNVRAPSLTLSLSALFNHTNISSRISLAYRAHFGHSYSISKLSLTLKLLLFKYPSPLEPHLFHTSSQISLVGTNSS